MTLNEDTYSLCYYESDLSGGTNKKGEVSLKGATVQVVERKTRKCFAVKIQDREFLLSPQTSEELEVWMQNIQEVIDQFNKLEMEKQN